MRLLMIPKTFLLAAVSIFCSCTTLPTPSGQPEVNIPASKKARFTANLTNELLNERWSVAEQSPNHMVFELVGLEGVQQIFSGQSHRPRTRLNFVEIDNSVRVVANLTVMTRRAFGGQFEEPALRTRYYQIWQDRLERAAR